jgi:hypothetical protein
MVKDKPAGARAAFEQYVSTEEPRLNDFRRTVAARGGPPETSLDLTRDSLAPLGAWLLEPMPPGPEDTQKPVWAWDRADDDPYLQGSWVPDGLGTYVAAMLSRLHPSLSWKLEDDRRSIYHGLPVLVGMARMEVLPYASVLGSLMDAQKASTPDPDWLVKLFDSWSALAAETAASGPFDADAELDRDLDDVTVEAIEGDPDWNAELSISEAAETVLGRDAYDRLYDRFAAIPGVERIEWEDRERFLLRLRRGSDRAAVRDAARRALRDARRGAPPRG